MVEMKKTDPDIGDDNVIIGKIGNRKIGERNVIIDATDDKGNTIINRPMIIGYKAKGGHNNIVIGSEAGSVPDLFSLLEQLKMISGTKDPETTRKILDLISELKVHHKNKSKIKMLWDSIKVATTIRSAANLIIEITKILGELLS